MQTGYSEVVLPDLLVAAMVETHSNE